MGILIQKQNIKSFFAHLQAFLSPFLGAEKPVSVTQPSSTQEFRVILQILSYKALRGDSQGNRIWVKCRTDLVTRRDNREDLIKCNTMLYQLRRCVGRLEKYREPKNPSQCSHVQKRNIIMLSGAAVYPRLDPGVLLIASCPSLKKDPYC